MATADGFACSRPAVPAHDVHDDRDMGLWILHPASVDELLAAPGHERYTGYRMLVAETNAQEEARYRFWFGDHRGERPRGAFRVTP